MGHDFEPLSARIIEAASPFTRVSGLVSGIVLSQRNGPPRRLAPQLQRLDACRETNCGGMRSNRSRKHESTKTRKWPRWRRSLVRGGFLSSSIETPRSDARSIDVNRSSKNKLRLYLDHRFLGLRPQGIVVLTTPPPVSPVVLSQTEMEFLTVCYTLHPDRRNSDAKAPQERYPRREVAILRRHLIDHAPVPDLCDKYQTSAIDLLRLAQAVLRERRRPFERKDGSPEQSHLRTIAALREKLQRKNEVVAELMEAISS